MITGTLNIPEDYGQVIAPLIPSTGETKPYILSELQALSEQLESEAQLTGDIRFTEKPINNDKKPALPRHDTEILPIENTIVLGKFENCCDIVYD